MTVDHLTLPVRSFRDATNGLPVLPTETNTWPSPTNTEPLIAPPSLSIWVSQTFWPVSALTANTQPFVEPRNRQPSAMTGVEPKSRSHQACDADSDNILVIVAACHGLVDVAAGCDRV